MTVSVVDPLLDLEKNAPHNIHISNMSGFLIPAPTWPVITAVMLCVCQPQQADLTCEPPAFTHVLLNCKLAAHVHTASRPCLSMWTLSLIMINNDDEDMITLLQRGRESKNVQGKILPFPCWFLVLMLELHWNTGIMWVWLSTDHFQVYLCWGLRVWCGKIGETLNLLYCSSVFCYNV